MHLGIIVDHPKRDLPGAAIMARAAAAIGWKVSLIPLYDQATDVPLLGLDAIVVNHARPANFALLHTYARLGIAIFVLDTEGGILAPSALELSARILRESGCAGSISGYLCWGAQQQAALVADGVISPERVFATGCPRFDFASPRWSGTLDFPMSDYILVNANFSLVNSRFTRSADEEARAVVEAGWDEGYIQGIVEDQHAILKDFLSVVRALAEKRPGDLFLLRPHPFERSDVYQEAFAGLPNVKIHGEGSVLNVIRMAKALLHVNCGTSVEALMLGKLPISLDFINRERIRKHVPLPSEISCPAPSFESAMGLLDDLHGVAARFDFAGNYEKFIFPWFHYNDGRSGERVIDAVTRASGSARPSPVSLLESLRGCREGSRVGQKIQGLLGNLFGSRAVSLFREKLSPRRREKRIVPGAVFSMVKLLCTHEGMPAFKVRRARHPWTGLPLSSVQVHPSRT